MRVARVLSVVPAITASAAFRSRACCRTPERERSDPFTAFFGTVLIYLFLSVYGSMILQGVAQEKGSRVIEILLSVVPARRMLSGKVIGIGVDRA